MRPFSEPEIIKASVNDQDWMRKFNRHLSSVQISIEHAFGILKGRFLSQALDKAPHINPGLGEARGVVTTKVDNSVGGQGPLGQGKANEKGMGLFRAVQGKTSLLLQVIQCKLPGLYVTTQYGLLHYDYLIRRTGPFIFFQPT